MISGVHAIVFSPASNEVRAFFRDALGLPNVDAGHGWLIFALPPAEVAVHPAEQPSHELYLMCDDLAATMANLAGAGASFGPVDEERWGRVTVMTIPTPTAAISGDTGAFRTRKVNVRTHQLAAKTARLVGRRVGNGTLAACRARAVFITQYPATMAAYYRSSTAARPQATRTNLRVALLADGPEHRPHRGPRRSQAGAYRDGLSLLAIRDA